MSFVSKKWNRRARLVSQRLANRDNITMLIGNLDVKACRLFGLADLFGFGSQF